jgi:hypothetical protein
MPILEEVRAVAQKRLLFLPHAIRQMSRPQRMITPTEAEAVAMRGEAYRGLSAGPARPFLRAKKVVPTRTFSPTKSSKTSKPPSNNPRNRV